MMRHIDAAACLSRWRAYPEAVILYCLGLWACVLLCPVWTAAPLVVAMAALSVHAGVGAPVLLFLRALALPVGFLLMGAVGLCLRIEGRGHWLPSLGIQGVWLAAEMSLRSLGASAVTLLLSLSLPLPRVLSLLRRLKAPEALLDLMLLTYRFIFMLDEVLCSLGRALANRLGGVDRRALRRSASLAGAALFVRAISRARDMERGLAARNYSGSLRVLEPPTSTRPVHVACAVCVPVLVAFGSHVPGWLGGGAR